MASDKSAEVPPPRLDQDGALPGEFIAGLPTVERGLDQGQGVEDAEKLVPDDFGRLRPSPATLM